MESKDFAGSYFLIHERKHRETNGKHTENKAKIIEKTKGNPKGKPKEKQMETQRETPPPPPPSRGAKLEKQRINEGKAKG